MKLKLPEKEVAALKMKATKFVASMYIGSSNLLSTLELVSGELNHFGLIEGLFRQIRGHTG